ncbi:hypothetical protein [Pedobacter endophyticus]|uniref:Uncharacterized protein n=1 Tax=Pedobacter endophyticus TaxID=2789740 RepID=A0A7S9Q0U1_9SPHI|nr:hypothetical protein [Pedobacter endophyticus]QPH41723.1 hypothetical protein IZT61_10910 [Pedobacter endophyticus]
MLSHYNYAFNGNANTYDFPTQNNILYRVAFIEDHTLSEISGENIPDIFQLVIEKVGGETESYDPRFKNNQFYN